MKNKILLYGGLGILGAAVIGIGIASAAGLSRGNGGGFGGPMMGMGGSGGFGMSFESPATMATNQATEFQGMASMLNIPESAVVSGWAAGQSLAQIASANGVTSAQLKTDMQTYQKQQAQAELSALVANGTVTQAQADERSASLASQQAKFQAAVASSSFNQNATSSFRMMHGRGGTWHAHASSTAPTSAATQ